MQLAVAAVLAVAVVAVVARFEQRCLQLLADTPDSELAFFSRQGWFMLIVFLIPIGGMLFLLRGRVP
jgi:hypothetical protein